LNKKQKILTAVALVVFCVIIALHYVEPSAAAHNAKTLRFACNAIFYAPALCEGFRR
jgi:hypothetical protein